MSSHTPQPHPPPLMSSESQANLLTVDESLRDAELEEVLDDLSSRFILNMPEPELSSTERISFQIEQAHWYYEDFVRPLNPAFPSMSLKRFSAMLFKACPLLSEFSHEQAFEDFQKYKSRVPVCGAVLLNPKMDKCILVKGWKSTAAWSFPKGKINQDESRAACAIREVYEETGYDFGAAGLLDKNARTTIEINEQSLTLYFVVGVPDDTVFETQTRKEISKIEWFALTELPTWTKKKVREQGKFYLVTPFVSALRAFVNAKKGAMKANGVHPEALPQGESDRSSSLGPVTPPGASMASMSQAVPPSASAGPSDVPNGAKPNGVAETDADRMSRLLSALSTGSSSTVTSAPPAPPPSVPMPALSPTSASSDRTDKHIALLDSLLGPSAGPSPGSAQTSRKASEGRPLPPIPSGSRVFPSNGPGGYPFPTNAPSPPHHAPPPPQPIMAPQPPPALQMMHAPPPMPPYHMDGPPQYTFPVPAPLQLQLQPSQPPSFLHNPQATYGYYPPAAYGSSDAPSSQEEARKGALLSLLGPSQPLPQPESLRDQHPSKYPSNKTVYQDGGDLAYLPRDPRSNLGVTGGSGLGPSNPPRMPQPSMSMLPMSMPPMHEPPSDLFIPGPMSLQQMNPPMNAPPSMNMFGNGPSGPFPPGPSFAPNRPYGGPSMRQTGDMAPSQYHPRTMGNPTQGHSMSSDFPYSGPSPDVSVDAFRKGLPRPREVQNPQRRNRVSGEQILYHPQQMPPPMPVQSMHTLGPAPMPKLDMPKPRQPENLLAILNSGPRPHLA
ncbi:DCP2-domain-containing protein [Calocera cornea HHB12733]|uniref:DCP2-domain-containing protein n=1 Tax=Calocera cornea HHB12733 TaxID=1353952 RepID=A0A165E9R0_9BASI|nr:DCP2-domain-containing protein [Calocera cornea HHB12733]